MSSFFLRYIVFSLIVNLFCLGQVFFMIACPKNSIWYVDLDFSLCNDSGFCHLCYAVEFFIGVIVILCEGSIDGFPSWPFLDLCPKDVLDFFVYKSVSNGFYWHGGLVQLRCEVASNCGIAV